MWLLYIPWDPCYPSPFFASWKLVICEGVDGSSQEASSLLGCIFFYESCLAESCKVSTNWLRMVGEGGGGGGRARARAVGATPVIQSSRRSFREPLLLTTMDPGARVTHAVMRFLVEPRLDVSGVLCPRERLTACDGRSCFWRFLCCAWDRWTTLWIRSSCSSLTMRR